MIEEDVKQARLEILVNLEKALLEHNKDPDIYLIHDIPGFPPIEVNDLKELINSIKKSIE